MNRPKKLKINSLEASISEDCIYIGVYDYDDRYEFLNSKQAKRLAEWLIKASKYVSKKEGKE